MKLLERLNGGIACVVQGAPKTGKSWLLGTAASMGKTKLLVLKAREVNSYQYVKHNIHLDAQIFQDPNWLPDLKAYESKAYLEFLRALQALYRDDETDIVIVDPLTDFDHFVDHFLLAPHKGAVPSDFPEGGMRFFGEKKKKFEDMLSLLTGLTHAPKPKIVLAAIHTQPTREEDLKKKKHRDAEARGILYHGSVLPAWEGSARYMFNADWDLTIYSHVERKPPQKVGEAPTTEYQIQVCANKDRHAGIALAPMLDQAYLPNDFPGLLKKIEEAI